MYLWTMSALHSIGWAIVLFYAVCCALRLARFNTQLSAEPAPAAAKGVTAVDMSWQRRRHAANSRKIQKVELLDPPLLIVAPASPDCRITARLSVAWNCAIEWSPS
jgi:hypothetical protein